MGKKLYVGNLSYEVDSSALEQLFTPHGTVTSAQIISDRETGRSKGFGFVEMGSDQEALAASNALNGKDHDGRALTVNEAKPRENRAAIRRRRWIWWGGWREPGRFGRRWTPILILDAKAFGSPIFGNPLYPVGNRFWLPGWRPPSAGSWWWRTWIASRGTQRLRL